MAVFSLYQYQMTTKHYHHIKYHSKLMLSVKLSVNSLVISLCFHRWTANFLLTRKACLGLSTWLVKFDESFRALRFQSVERVPVRVSFIVLTVVRNNLRADFFAKMHWRRCWKHCRFFVDLQKTSHWGRRENGIGGNVIENCNKVSLVCALKIDSYRVNVNHVEINHEIWTWPYIVLFKYFELFSIY